MKKAIFISLAKVLAVWLLDKAIRYYILKVYTTSKDQTTVEVYNLALKKIYLLSSANILFSILLYFLLMKLTVTSNFIKFILCIATFILNIVLYHFF
jgi:hypothetical protein